MARYSNTAGQKEAPKAEAKSTKNTFKADDAGSKGTKVIPYKAKETEEKKSYAGTWGKGSDSKVAAVESKPEVKPEVKAAPVAKPAVKAAKPAQETAASRASRQAAYDDWKSSQKALGAPGMKKGGTAKKKMACGGKAYAKGGLVKSSKAINGCASKGLTKGASR